MDIMTVRCKHCGAENRKTQEAYSVKCTSCGGVTVYYVKPRKAPSR